MKKCKRHGPVIIFQHLSALTVAASNFRFAVASFCSPKKNFNRSPTYLVFVRILVGAVLGDGWVGSTPKGDDCLLRDAEKDASKLSTYRSKSSEIPYHNWAIMLETAIWRGTLGKGLASSKTCFRKQGIQRQRHEQKLSRNSEFTNPKRLHHKLSDGVLARNVWLMATKNILHTRQINKNWCNFYANSSCQVHSRRPDPLASDIDDWMWVWYTWIHAIRSKLVKHQHIFCKHLAWITSTGSSFLPSPAKRVKTSTSYINLRRHVAEETLLGSAWSLPFSHVPQAAAF